LTRGRSGDVACGSGCIGRVCRPLGVGLRSLQASGESFVHNKGQNHGQRPVCLRGCGPARLGACAGSAGDWKARCGQCAWVAAPFAVSARLRLFREQPSLGSAFSAPTWLSKSKIYCRPSRTAKMLPPPPPCRHRRSRRRLQRHALSSTPLTLQRGRGMRVAAQCSSEQLAFLERKKTESAGPAQVIAQGGGLKRPLCVLSAEMDSECRCWPQHNAQQQLTAAWHVVLFA